MRRTVSWTVRTPSSGSASSGCPRTPAGRARPCCCWPTRSPFPIDAFLEAAGRPAPGPHRGRRAWRRPASAPGGNRLVLDDAVHTDGAVGVLLGPEWPVTTVVSQGCRPIGDPFTVTRAERSMHLRARGRAGARPAAGGRRGGSTATTARWPGQGLHLGRVIDEHRADFGRGDFLDPQRAGGRPRRRRHRGRRRGRGRRDRAVPGARRRVGRRGPAARCWPTPRRRPRSCSRATGGASGCSASPTTTPRSSADVGRAGRRRHVLRRRDRPGRAPAPSSTASPRRSPCSGSVSWPGPARAPRIVGSHRLARVTRRPTVHQPDRSAA